MRRLFAEGAFSQAFVPVLAEYQKTRSAEDVRTFIARISGYLSSILTLVTVVGIVASPVIIFYSRQVSIMTASGLNWQLRCFVSLFPI